MGLTETVRRRWHDLRKSACLSDKGNSSSQENARQLPNFVHVLTRIKLNVTG
jgi:hypothetical protein